jgi:hypothetical protein
MMAIMLAVNSAEPEMAHRSGDGLAGACGNDGCDVVVGISVDARGVMSGIGTEGSLPMLPRLPFTIGSTRRADEAGDIGMTRADSPETSWPSMPGDMAG